MGELTPLLYELDQPIKKLRTELKPLVSPRLCLPQYLHDPFVREYLLSAPFVPQCCSAPPDLPQSRAHAALALFDLARAPQ